MNIYFKNSNGESRIISTIDSQTPSPTDVLDVIKSFCDERNFIIYYYRMWHELHNGVMMTKFDVGSHTEFFYADYLFEIENGV